MLPDNATEFVWSPSRAGLDSARVQFPGFPSRLAVDLISLQPGEARWQPLSAGDILNISVPANATLALACLTESNEFSLAALKLPLDCVAAPQHFYAAEIEQRLRNRGLSLGDAQFTMMPGQIEKVPVGVRERAVIIAVSLSPADDLVSGNAADPISLELSRVPSVNPELPEPLGAVRDEFTVTRGTAQAYELAKGEYVQVIDVEGRQCSDFMAMNNRALEKGRERHLDSTITRTLMGGAYPAPGLFDKFFDQDMKPMLALVQDTVGRHDTFALACTARGYEDRGFPGHLNCSDNISHAYAPFGIQRRPAWPAINFFFNSWIYPTDNRIQSDEAWSRPGDYVLMEALNDLTCVSTACPDDVDPINGWNPTDIHVRIYKPALGVRRSVAYRATPQAKPVMTRESPFHSRTSSLTRHFSVARDYWMPQVFDASGALEEYWASHNAATIQDMSSLRKLDITGPDAERLLQLATTRDVRKLAVNRGSYSLMCDERGAVIDDGTLFRLAPDVFRWCCGSDDSALQLAKIAEQEQLTVWVKDLSNALCNIAVQGPKSREILARIVFTRSAQPQFENIKWFGFAIARLHDREGRPFMVARSGYTGQLGYEIFCDRQDAGLIWDEVMKAGKDDGLLAQGNQALDILRIEAGLMAAGAEFTDDVDADEAGLGFAVDMNKDTFYGKQAIERNRTAPRRKLVGLLFEGDEVPMHGDGVFVDRRQVGVVTSAVRSPQMHQVIAMARVAIECSEIAMQLSVGKLDGHMKRLPCSVTSLPFIDPERAKPRA